MAWRDDIAAAAKTRLSRSTASGGVVVQSPATLLAQANEIAACTLAEYTGARLIASEYGRGSPTELACLVDTEMNRDGRGTLLHLIVNGKYGSQGVDGRKASTLQDPTFKHLIAARAVLDGRARGVSRGAERFFDPKVQDDQYRKWKAGLSSKVHSCDALSLLEAWSFDYPGKTAGRRCPADTTRPGPHKEQWVGPIDGVNPYILMLMKPATSEAEHLRMYQAARQVILSKGGAGAILLSLVGGVAALLGLDSALERARAAATSAGGGSDWIWYVGAALVVGAAVYLTARSGA